LHRSNLTVYPISGSSPFGSSTILHYSAIMAYTLLELVFVETLVIAHPCSFLGIIHCHRLKSVAEACKVKPLEENLFFVLLLLVNVVFVFTRRNYPCTSLIFGGDKNNSVLGICGILNEARHFKCEMINLLIVISPQLFLQHLLSG
jgi:hypothetical protein